MKTHLLIIDPQNDFCDPNGVLYVKGAENDIIRISNLIRRLKYNIDKIHITLDTHHKFDICHPLWWKDAEGNNPNPFTIINLEDYPNKWRPSNKLYNEETLFYLKTLELNKKNNLCIWPEHCLIGSWGNAIENNLFNTLFEWENESHSINYIIKGENPFTEHYSAIKAEVVLEDPKTHVNNELIKELLEVDRILVVGEASSHCLAESVKDLINIESSLAENIVILTDCMSPVTGFEDNEKEFFDFLNKYHVKLIESKKIN